MATKHVKGAYDELVIELRELREKKEELNKTLRELSAREAQLNAGIDGLKPLLNQDQEAEETRPVIKWKSVTLAFLRKYRGKAFTSPQLLEYIHPHYEALNKDDRRRAMISLSATLSSLMMDGLVRSKNNSDGRGNLYSAVEDEVLTIGTLMNVLENEQSPGVDGTLRE